MKSKSIMVPQLRFPEFRDDGDWQTSQLSDLYGFKRTNTLSRDKLNYKVGMIRNIHYGDIHSKFQPMFRVDSEHVPFINPDVSVEAFDEKNDCEEGDIVLADASEDLNDVGKAIEIVSLDGQRVVAGTHTILATRHGNVPILGFGGYLFQSAPVRMIIKKESQGAKVYGISAKRISPSVVPLPRTNKEQKKIADCLSSLDELIAAEGRKLDALRNHKLGLMQRLFSQLDKTQPQLRFPEFKNKGKWEKRKLSILLKKSVRPVTVEAGNYYQEIGIRSHGKGIFHKEPVVGVALGNKRVFWVEEDAFVVNIVFAWEQAVAVTSAAERGMIASHRFPMYKTNKNKSDLNFINYLFMTQKGKELLGIASPGGAGRNKTLGQKTFENLDLFSPKSVKEQTKIARILSLTDDLIDTQSHKVDTLKIHKKGLLQLLFPAPEEQ